MTTDKIILRNYPKAIFFYPLFFMSLILAFIQGSLTNDLKWLGFIWMICFFCNLVVVLFDFSTSRFFILILGGIIVSMFFILFLLPMILERWTGVGNFTFGITSNFYLTITCIVGLVIIGAIIEAIFDYWKIERNEIYHRKGLFRSERYPTKGLQVIMDIPDVFEFLGLRAGSITLKIGIQTFHLPTIINVKKKSEQIDWLLSHLAVESDII